MPDNPRAAIGLAKCFSLQDRYRDAEKFFDIATTKKPENADFHLLQIRNQAHFKGPKDTLYALQRLAKTFPNHPGIRLDIANIYQTLGQLTLALDVLNPILTKNSEAKGRQSIAIKAAEILVQTKEINKAEELLFRVLNNQPNYGPALNALLALSKQSQKPEKIQNILKEKNDNDLTDFAHLRRYYRFLKTFKFDQLAEESRLKFKARKLALGQNNTLESLLKSCGTVQLKPYFNKTIWRAWRLSGLPETEWDRWRFDTAWNKCVRRKSWEFLATSLNEKTIVDDLFLSPDVKDILKEIDNGQGVLIAGTHQAPSALTTRYLETFIPQFSSLTNALFNMVCSDAKHFSSQGQPVSTMRNLVNKLGKGQSIGIAIDTPKTTDAIAIPFLGGDIFMSPLIARLSHKYRTPSYALNPYWVGDKFKIDFIKLPLPKKGEDKETFIQRWCRSYLKEYEKPLKSDGRLIDIYSASWSKMRFPDQSVLSE